ncbi:DUF6090 family protein [Psychroserpens sp. SPM9]|uniref:DUF6090 family protein n=1 Tax=Psychroserpens sp. SPM9 TaxID=2975598 RepID=UPI0021A459FF|nr:DUF6090 family protein [Psychroserpens sp. SPM9]MDG5492002.1 DUF6090 family protein [Psychroserpens sp. SPM9]
MIKFFRHIRKQLLSENKTGKPSNRTGRYLKYAIGEIVLVVIGILIALQINNWNENRLNNKALKAYLTSFTQDLNSEKEGLDVIVKWHSFKYYSMQYLLKMEGSNPYDPIADRKSDIPSFNTQNYPFWDKELPEVHNKEFIQLTYSIMHRAVIYPMAKSTFEELKSSGMYSKINPKIKYDIEYYYGAMENDFNGKVQSLAIDFQESLAKDGFITTDTYKLPDPISLLKNNPERIGLIKRMIRESGWTVQSAINATARNEELKQLIEKEIASL